MLSRVAHSTIALASRLFPTVLVRTSNDTAARTLIEQARAINPAGIQERVYGTTDDARTLQVGRGVAEAPLVHIDASGWRVFASTSGERAGFSAPRLTHPASPLIAASLGIGQFVRPILGRSAERGSHRLDLLSYRNDFSGPNPAIPSQVSLGEVPVFGIGSIGSAVMECFRGGPTFDGTLVLVDNQSLADGNLARYPPMDARDVGREKTIWASELIREAQPKLTVDPQQRDISHFARDVPPEKRYINAIICPDNYDARREAADLLPLKAVVASIDGTEAFVHHCHFARTRCGYCPHVPDFDLDGEKYEDRIAKLTGLQPRRVVDLRLPHAPDFRRMHLATGDLRIVERTLNYPPGALARWQNGLLEELLEAERGRIYAAAAVTTSSQPPARVVLAAVSAAAGALAMNELLKELMPEFHLADSGYSGFKLDPIAGTASREGRLIQARDRTGRCICRSHDRHRWFADMWPDEVPYMRTWTSALGEVFE